MTDVVGRGEFKSAHLGEVVWFPLLWDLTGRRVMVIGGGAMAEAKTLLLIKSQARVTVIAASVTGALANLAESGRIEWVRRGFRSGDLVGVTLAIAATDDVEANGVVHAEAESLGIPVNAVDDPARCSVIFPAVHRDGPLVVAVSTSGVAPAVAVRIRDRVAKVTRGYGAWLGLLRGFRQQIRSQFHTFEERCRVWYGIADSVPAFDASRAGDEVMAASLVQDVIDRFAKERAEPTASIVSSPLSRLSPERRAEARMGRVRLVGAGPGACDLLTVRAVDAIRGADVVLHDRLVGFDVLKLVPASAELIDVGKRHGDEHTQARILDLLADRAGRGRTVVRLKGGDPMVFGRGGEEFRYLTGLAIPVDVIPGVTTAVGVPSSIGLPLTHRQLASGFAVVAGQAVAGRDWARYSLIDTLVILMGATRRVEIASDLIASGRPPSDPVAFIEAGTTPQQKVIVGALAEVAAGTIEVTAPVVWVCGPVVDLLAQRFGEGPAVRE